MRILFAVLIVFLAAGSAVTSAEVYKWVNEDGEIIYSDRLEKGAEPLDVPNIQTYKPAPYRPIAPRPEPAEPANPYVRFEVISPKNDATIRDNEGKVAVSLLLEPRLRPGHRIRLSMDGKLHSKPLTTTNIQLSQVDRGSHTISAVVFDGKGNEVVSSPAITFHLKRISRLLTPNRAP